MQSNTQQYYPSFYTFYASHFSRVRHPSHPGRGHGSLTCHKTQFERSDWLRSENLPNIMIECYTHILTTYLRQLRQSQRTNSRDKPLTCIVGIVDIGELKLENICIYGHEYNKYWQEFMWNIYIHGEFIIASWYNSDRRQRLYRDNVSYVECRFV